MADAAPDDRQRVVRLPVVVKDSVFQSTVRGGDEGVREGGEEVGTGVGGDGARVERDAVGGVRDQVQEPVDGHLGADGQLDRAVAGSEADGAHPVLGLQSPAGGRLRMHLEEPVLLGERGDLRRGQGPYGPAGALRETDAQGGVAAVTRLSTAGGHWFAESSALSAEPAFAGGGMFSRARRAGRP